MFIIYKLKKHSSKNLKREICQISVDHSVGFASFKYWKIYIINYCSEKFSKNITLITVQCTYSHHKKNVEKWFANIFLYRNERSSVKEIFRKGWRIFFRCHKDSTSRKISLGIENCSALVRHIVKHVIHNMTRWITDGCSNETIEITLTNFPKKETFSWTSTVVERKFKSRCLLIDTVPQTSPSYETCDF